MHDVHDVPNAKECTVAFSVFICMVETHFVRIKKIGGSAL